MLNNLFKFCVLGNAILRVDTTFELVDGLWLTDTTYTNEALVDLKGKHPEYWYNLFNLVVYHIIDLCITCVYNYQLLVYYNACNIL